MASSSSSWHGGRWLRPSQRRTPEAEPQPVAREPHAPIPQSLQSTWFDNDVAASVVSADQDSSGSAFGDASSILVYVKVLGTSSQSFELTVQSWSDFVERLEECGIPSSEQHFHRFSTEEDIEVYAGQTLELISHELWVLLSIIPEGIRPQNHLDVLVEVKLRLGQKPQMRLRSQESSSSLLEISDNVVTEKMLHTIVGNRCIAPGPHQFHNGRAGVIDWADGIPRSTLHRITAVNGHAGSFASPAGTSWESANEVLMAAAAELGRRPDEVQPYIHIVVEENWYSSVESLRTLTADQWKQMKIPMCLVDAVTKKINARAYVDSSDEKQLAGLTLRVGRPIYGACLEIEDMLEACRSTLLIGQGGAGKSTVLREMSRLLSDAYNKCVVVVDTTSELGGFGNIPHRALGVNDVTRLQVPKRSELFQVMLDAVQNHSARVVVVDELRDASEVAAARTIANQGVVLLASVHATCLEQLAHNPTLSPLIGGVKSAPISDVRMREIHSESKFVEYLEGKPAFSTVIEIKDCGTWRIHDNVARAVNNILKGHCDGSREIHPNDVGEDVDLRDDTGSTSNGSSSIEVQRAGVGKVPLQLMAKLCSGGAYMCCFDGGVTWARNPNMQDCNVGGAGSCLFHIRTDGKNNIHLRAKDQTVFLPDATRDLAECAGLLAGVLSFTNSLRSGDLVPAPSMLLVEGDAKFIIQHVQEAIEQRSGQFELAHDHRLQPMFDLVVDTLRELKESGIKVCARYRQRRFNKVADQLTRKARSERNGNFEHHLLDSTLSQGRSGPELEDVQLVVLSYRLKNLDLLEEALSKHHFFGRSLLSPGDAAPPWAQGAKVLTPSFTKTVAISTALRLGRQHVILLEKDLNVFMEVLSSIPSKNRPKLPKAGMQKFRIIGGVATTPAPCLRSQAKVDESEARFGPGSQGFLFTARTPSLLQRAAEFLKLHLFEKARVVCDDLLSSGVGLLGLDSLDHCFTFVPSKAMTDLFDDCFNDVDNHMDARGERPPCCLRRVLPLDYTIHPTLEAFQQLLPNFLAPHFVSCVSWALHFDTYGPSAISKRDAFRVVEGVIGRSGKPHTVNLNNPDKCVVIQVNQLVCGISVLDNWEALGKCNFGHYVQTRESQDRPCGDEWIELDRIHYSQDSISNTFSTGENLVDAISGLRSGSMIVLDFPTIDVVEYQRTCFSLNNRRLYCFKSALPRHTRIPVRWQGLTTQFLNNFSTRSFGLSVFVRAESSESETSV